MTASNPYIGGINLLIGLFCKTAAVSSNKTDTSGSEFISLWRVLPWKENLRIGE